MRHSDFREPSRMEVIVSAVGYAVGGVVVAAVAFAGFWGFAALGYALEGGL